MTQQHTSAPHLLFDLSAHGLGHLAQAAPILNHLAKLRPDCRLSLRSALSLEKLRARLDTQAFQHFEHLQQASDFGFVMHDAVHIDFAKSAANYRELHAKWDARVATEADFLRGLAPDLVLSDVAYLPLAGAAQAGIASLSMCSLNWADLFAHFFISEPWAPPIYQQILAAYRSSACFLRLTPAMPMPDLPKTCAIAPVAALGQNRRAALQQKLRQKLQQSQLASEISDQKLILIAFGGFAYELGLEHWPVIAGVHYLIPGPFEGCTEGRTEGCALARRPDMSRFDRLDFSFTDLLKSVDAVLTKPGYGIFTEAACNGSAVLYVRRDDWPEQDCLIAWLQQNARCAEVPAADLASGHLSGALSKLWVQSPPSIPQANGAQAAAQIIAQHLTGIAT